MILFLFKGLIRDKSRSIFPVLIIAAGVFLTVMLQGYLKGAIGSMVETTAAYSSGHVKIVTQGYAKQEDQMPNDLSLLNLSSLTKQLKTDYPEWIWLPRIQFAGLLDIPDEQGDTREQGPVIALAIDLIEHPSNEKKVMKLDEVLVRGELPLHSGEILVSDTLAQKLNLNIGEAATFLGSTADGSMAAYNFIVVGTVHFGMQLLDKSSILVDLSDAQVALNLEDSASHVLGFSKDLNFNEKNGDKIKSKFNDQQIENGEFTPVMLAIKDQAMMGSYLDISNVATFILLACFIFTMSLVLWNSRLMGNIRRYGEIGVRLAIGESKRHVIWTMILESMLLGLLGTALGTALALPCLWYLQVYGIDISYATRNSTLMISDIIRAQISGSSFFIGLVPGLLAPTLGTLFSAYSVFRRQTSQLFKELEV